MFPGGILVAFDITMLGALTILAVCQQTGCCKREIATLKGVEQARGFFGVLPEQLVEVAHAVEQQRVGVPGLEGQILLHHGRVVRERVRHAVRCE